MAPEKELNLEKIEMGHSVKYQQYTITRYIAGDRLGWIIRIYVIIISNIRRRCTLWRSQR